MTEKLTYPSIDDSALTPFRVLRLLFRSNPGMLDAPDCPYTSDQKTFLAAMLTTGGDAVDEDRVSGLSRADDPFAYLREQVALALEDIRILENKSNTIDQKDRIAFLKAKPGLLEKLIELEERLVNMQVLSGFMKKIYAFIDKQLTTDQRTDLMKALEGQMALVKA